MPDGERRGLYRIGGWHQQGLSEAHLWVPSDGHGFLAFAVGALRNISEKKACAQSCARDWHGVGPVGSVSVGNETKRQVPALIVCAGLDDEVPIGGGIGSAGKQQRMPFVPAERGTCVSIFGDFRGMPTTNAEG